MPWRKGKKILSIKELKKRGKYRVDKLVKKLRIKYPNASVIAVSGKGTDIIIIENKRVVEAWEVTNWSRYDYEKKYLIHMHPDRKDMIIKSLTKKRFGAYRKKWTASQDLKRFLAVSYMSNIPKNFRVEFSKHKIKIVPFARQDFLVGYKVQDKKGNTKAYYNDGTPLPP